VVNFKNAPSYYLAKTLTKLFSTYTALPNVFNVKNSAELIQDLKSIPYEKNLKLASFDIDSMYTNIPTADLPQILEKWCTLHNVDSNIRQEIHSITNLVIEQNYFKFKDTIYRQRPGLAMGSRPPLSYRNYSCNI
jgi:hypothetical protein